jgi:hypothetical protein
VTLQGIIDAALKEAGIDATQAQAQGWALDRYRRLVGGAKWRKLKRPIATTVAGQAAYQVADDVVDVLSLRVGRSAPYKLISIEELWEIESGASVRITSRGLFAPAFDDDDALEYVELFPVPETDGETITALCAVIPPDIALTDEPKVPRDFDHVIKAGVIADGLALIDEDPAAASWEAVFQEGVERLRRRRNSRIGSGPAAVRLLR